MPVQGGGVSRTRAYLSLWPLEDVNKIKKSITSIAKSLEFEWGEECLKVN